MDPWAGNDTYAVTAGTTLTVSAPGVLANDSDIDGGALTAVLVSPPANGALTLSANGSSAFTPPANLTGVVTFSYAAHDGLAMSTAIVSITVQPGATSALWRLASGLLATTSGSSARGGHTATLLPNGNVVVIGGTGTVDATRQAQVYDPATRTWRLGAYTGESRSGHTATLLPNGKVLVVGGFPMIGSLPVERLESCGLYDPASGTWTPTGRLLPTSGGSTGRALHTATLLASGKVLVVGGIGTNPTTPRNARSTIRRPAGGVTPPSCRNHAPATPRLCSPVAASSLPDAASDRPVGRFVRTVSRVHRPREVSGLAHWRLMATLSLIVCDLVTWPSATSGPGQ